MKKINKFYVLSFFIPCVLMILLYLSVGVIGGNKNILTVDLADQYIEFFNALKNIFDGKISPFYSFSKTLGGNMFGLITYYLISPFNFLIVFFDRLSMPQAILMINILKIACSGLTSFIYFNKSFKNNEKISLAFSIIYAFMSYNIVYSQNIMWLDGVILLPLVFLGIDNLIKNRPTLFYVTLTLSIVCNYYIGYMICIGSIIYYLYKIYILDNKISINKLFYFVKVLLLSVLTSSITLIPSLFSLLQGKASGFLSQLVPNQKFAIFDLITRFFIGSFKNKDILGTLPNVYVSLIIIVLVIYYFFNKKIDLREKKASLILVLIFVFSLAFSSINVIWHMFKHPVGFPFRYSFIFDFVLLIIAYKSILSIDKIGNDFIKKFIFYSFLLTMVVDKFMYNSTMYYKVFGTFVLVVIYLVYLSKKKNDSISNFIIVLIVCEMFLNSYLIVLNIKYEDKNLYRDFVINTGGIIDNINDDSFYRLEKDYSYSTNDELLLNYKGISHFSSVYEENNNKLLGKYLGIFNRFYITNYYGSTLVTNSLFNIKYLLSHDSLSYYPRIDSFDDINVYLNRYNLPLGFMVDDDILSLELKEYEPFINQNNILKSMDNNIDDVFYKNEFNVKLNNLRLDGNTYVKVNKNIDASLKFNVSLNHSGLLYGFLSSKSHDKIDILLNGKSLIDINDENSFYYNTFSLGEFYKSDSVTIEVLLLDDKLRLDDVMFYTLDLGKFNEAVRILNDNAYLDIIDYKHDYIKANVLVSDDLVLYTSIPYDSGFKVYVDGKKVKTDKCLDSLLCLDLDNGSHEVILKYETRGLRSGFVLSLIGIVGFVVIRKRYNKGGNL